MKSTKRFLTTIIICCFLASCDSGAEKKSESETLSDKPTTEVPTSKHTTTCNQCGKKLYDGDTGYKSGHYSTKVFCSSNCMNVYVAERKY